MSQNYKDTLNLPRTDFPMKANLAARAPELLRTWQENAAVEAGILVRQISLTVGKKNRVGPGSQRDLSKFCPVERTSLFFVREKLQFQRASRLPKPQA